MLSILGLGALVYAIIEGPHHGWLSVESALWFGAAAVLLVAFGFWEWRNRHPMLDLHLFQNPRFAVSSGGITLVFFAMFGSFFMLAQYFQGVIGWSPLSAALRLLPFSAVMMVVAPNTPKLVARLGANRVGAIGLTSVAVGHARHALFFGVDTVVLGDADRDLLPRRRHGDDDDADDDAADGGRAPRPRRHGLGDERHDPRARRRARRRRARLAAHRQVHLRRRPGGRRPSRSRRERGRRRSRRRVRSRRPRLVPDELTAARARSSRSSTASAWRPPCRRWSW